MTGQLERLGFSFDWSRSFMSSDPEMYRWSQWLFLELLEAGLIYRGHRHAWTGARTARRRSPRSRSSRAAPAGAATSPVRLIGLPQWYLGISAYVPENDARLAELQDSGIWDEVALASQQIVLGRIDGVELELRDAAGERAGALHPLPRRARAGALRADQPAPPGGRERGPRARTSPSSSSGCARAAGSAAPARPTRSRCSTPAASLIGPAGGSCRWRSPRWWTPASAPRRCSGCRPQDRSDEVLARRLGTRARGRRGERRHRERRSAGRERQRRRGP